MEIAAKAFGGRTVLAGVRFAAAAGEVLALLAPSGAGKTTALRIVLGLDRGYSGSVARPQGRMAAVFQEPRLLPWLSLAGNIALVAPDLVRAEVAELLDAVELRDQGALLPKQVSLGMARRAAIARALAVRPALLVLDEPFVSLDPGLAGRLAAVVARRARAGGAVVLMATHDLDQALAVADRVLVLEGGTLATEMACRDASADALRARFGFLQEGRTGGTEPVPPDPPSIV